MTPLRPHSSRSARPPGRRAASCDAPVDAGGNAAEFHGAGRRKACGAGAEAERLDGEMGQAHIEQKKSGVQTGARGNALTRRTRH